MRNDLRRRVFGLANGGKRMVIDTARASEHGRRRTQRNIVSSAGGRMGANASCGDNLGQRTRSVSSTVVSTPRRGEQPIRRNTRLSGSEAQNECVNGARKILNGTGLFANARRRLKNVAITLILRSRLGAWRISVSGQDDASRKSSMRMVGDARAAVRRILRSLRSTTSTTTAPSTGEASDVSRTVATTTHGNSLAGVSRTTFPNGFRCYA